MVRFESQTRLVVMLGAALCLVAGSAFAISTDGSPQPPPGPAQEGFPDPFVEDFDSYAAGSNMHGQGDWKGWDNNPGAGALVTNALSNSPPNSVEIAGPSDLVHEFLGYTTGQWTLTAWSYVPGNHTGISYLIALNTYNDGGPYNWSTQIQLNSNTNQVISDFDGGTLPLVRDTWMEFRIEIDLDADLQTIYYGNMLLAQKSWTEGVSGGGAVNIGAIDLFANGTSSVFYDDVSLCPTGVGCVVPTVNDRSLAVFALLLLVAGLGALALRRPGGAAA